MRLVSPFVSGLSRNLFRILKNIPGIVSIKNRRNGGKCIIYVWLVAIDLRTYTKKIVLVVGDAIE